MAVGIGLYLILLILFGGVAIDNIKSKRYYWGIPSLFIVVCMVIFGVLALASIPTVS